MYSLIKQLHSLSAYITLAVLIAATVNALIGYYKKKKYFEVKDLRLSLFALVFAHIQLLLGLVLYVLTPLLSSWQQLGMKVMKVSNLRLLLLEHPLVMIIAVTLITIGWSKLKKQSEVRKMFGSIALFYTLALACVLAIIPWKLWFA